jgi:hypothetical protein
MNSRNRSTAPDDGALRLHPANITLHCEQVKAETPVVCCHFCRQNHPTTEAYQYRSLWICESCCWTIADEGGW